MSWLSVLRAILTFVFFFSCIGALTAPFMAWMAYSEYMERVSDLFDTQQKLLSRFLFALVVINYWLFVVMIYYLKKSAYKIKKRYAFQAELQKYLYRAGLLCVIATLIKLPISILMNSDYLFLPVQNDGYYWQAFMEINPQHDLLIMTSFGIFLIILSKVVGENLSLKEDVKYTV
jgi:hypothetical protein